MKIVTTNKRANFEYFVLEKFVAGISLEGSEVKSVRAGHVSINESFVQFRSGEAFIHNMYIKQYQAGGHFAPDERRVRKLLLNRREIERLTGAVAQKGLTVVPLKVYFERQWVKIEIGLCRGKKLYDKRESIKRRELDRHIQREVKNSK